VQDKKDNLKVRNVGAVGWLGLLD